ncbi:MAG: glutamate-5-semialdehyde dehydrogenase [Xanthomonadales bacterium]|nr:glutamate-5-semialdehyde dehydrogenase [Xanthomonadales bacterium]
MSESLREAALKCRDASAAIGALDTQRKNALLQSMADALDADADAVLAANVEDMVAAKAKGISVAMLDRLQLDATRLAALAHAVREVAALPDPVGQVTRSETSAKGFDIDRVRVPLGVIAMIYEARPNVTADAAALCLKAGNTVILRGGSEAVRSNRAIAACLRAALVAADLPADAIVLLDDLSRDAMIELLQLSDIVDLAIPRGGEGLIRFVTEHARVPVIKHYKGVCHLYVDASADLDLALNLLIDGKTSRTGVCNALETLLISSDIAAKFLPRAVVALAERGVVMLGDKCARSLCPSLGAASDDDYAAEFLDLKIAIRVVADVDAAIEHIRRFGSDHTEVIATQDDAAAKRFVRGLRSAVIMVNVSSRFSDGGELGLGSEIGISTTRLHAYGPMGAEALTIERFVIRGSGQVRHAQSKVA